jgi:hypothetical protein
MLIRRTGPPHRLGIEGCAGLWDIVVIFPLQSASARQSNIVGATLLDSGASGDVGLLSLSSVQSRLDGD